MVVERPPVGWNMVMSHVAINRSGDESCSYK